MIHINDGSCKKCQSIIDKFPDFNSDLREWFEQQQAEYPAFHCSDAGRGRIEQETYFNRQASKAHYGESSHNYGCGIDTFWLISGKYNVDVELYKKYIQPTLPEFIFWGFNWVSFPETPHFEIKNWKELVTEHLVSLVE